MSQYVVVADFNPYEVRRRIRSIHSDADIYEIQVPQFAIKTGAFRACHELLKPEGPTIVVFIVDPGVGSKRPALIARANDCYWIGADPAGIGLWFAAMCERGVPVEIFEIDYDHYNEWFRQQYGITVAQTFHGRDVFAPIAAHIGSGMWQPDTFGTERKNQIDGFIFPKEGEVVEIYLPFGNIKIIASQALRNNLCNYQEAIVYRSKGAKDELLFRAMVGRCFSEANVTPILFPSPSYGVVELALRQANIAEQYQIKVGDLLRLECFSMPSDIAKNN